MSILFDNDAFEKHCKSVNPLQRLRKNGTHEDLTNLAGEKKNYAQINSMVSQLHLILFELTVQINGWILLDESSDDRADSTLSLLFASLHPNNAHHLNAQSFSTNDILTAWYIIITMIFQIWTFNSLFQHSCLLSQLRMMVQNNNSSNFLSLGMCSPSCWIHVIWSVQKRQLWRNRGRMNWRNQQNWRQNNNIWNRIYCRLRMNTGSFLA